MSEYKPLKLIAKDAEDIAVVSAMLQDALVPVHDMTFDAASKQFIMVVSRFCWERLNPPGQNMLRPCERVHCALRVDGVQGVKTQQIDLKKKSDILELLAVMTDDDGLQLVFAGGPKLKLLGDAWVARVEDLGEPWPVSKAPCHDVLLQAG